MTRRSRNRVLAAVILLAAGTWGLFAGGKKEAGTANAQAGGDQTTFASFRPFDPPIEVRTVRRSTPPEVTRYPEGESVNNNIWTREYEKRLGIRIKYDWVVDESGFDEKTNIMIASGDLPDYFLATATQLAQLVRADAVEDLTDVFRRYSSPFTRGVFEEAGPLPLESATYGGKLMAIPFLGEPKQDAPVLYVRKDWMDTLGLAPPKTMQDLLRIADAFTKRDPDGNGQNDTFGIIADQTAGVNVDVAAAGAYSSLDGFFYGYHAYPKIWIKDASGKLVFGGILPEAKQALASLQQLYREGIIDPSFGSKDFDKNAEDLIAGRAGIVYHYFWAPLYPFQVAYNSDPKVKWAWYPMLSVDSRPAMVTAGLGTWGYWVVRKGYAHPEVLPLLVNVFTDIYYANTSDEIFDRFVNEKDGNAVWENAHAQIKRGLKDIVIYRQNVAVLEAKLDPSKLTPEERGVYSSIKEWQAGNADKRAWFEIYGTGGSMGVLDTYIQKNLYLDNLFYGAPTPAMVRRSAGLGTLQTEAYTAIIKGAPIADFDKFVQQWLSQGGEEITKEVNEWYASRK